jgi:hypothetical protein
VRIAKQNIYRGRSKSREETMYQQKEILLTIIAFRTYACVNWYKSYAKKPYGESRRKSKGRLILRGGLGKQYN